jgi:hypothetical protein
MPKSPEASGRLAGRSCEAWVTGWVLAEQERPQQPPQLLQQGHERQQGLQQGWQQVLGQQMRTQQGVQQLAGQQPVIWQQLLEPQFGQPPQLQFWPQHERRNRPFRRQRSAPNSEQLWQQVGQDG